MQTKFKRHERIILAVDPNPEYVEYESDFIESSPPITKGMHGRINVILPNGQYHVAVLNSQGEVIAYVLLDEEFLQSDIQH